MVVAHNLSAMNAQRQFNIVGNSKKKSTEKLSSGYKINRAADDAAGLAISEKMRWMIRGLHQGTENTQDGISFVQIGDGAMGEIHDMIDRIEELAVKGANETLTDIDRGMIDEEIKQLKKQINQISKSTVFNEKRIFDNSSSINVTGVPDDMSLFNASYNDATGDYSYGGFIFQGERVTWDKVDSNMVDTATNTFTGGEYSYSAGGKTYLIKTEAGGTIPEITRTMSVSASTAGISIDGEIIGWDKIYNEDGLNGDEVGDYSGGWNLDYHGASVSFWMDETVNSRDEMIDEINNIMNKDQKVHYVWEEAYAGDHQEKAVSVGKIKDLRISTSLATIMAADPAYELTVKADNTGISLIDKDGNVVADSAKTWDSMGISKWDEGSYITSERPYTYAIQENGETTISFEFNLTDETSLDSVIDGLDGMKIKASSINSHYMTKVSEDPEDANLNITASARINVSFAEEIGLGRDFDQKDTDIFYSKDNKIQYDATNDIAKASILSKSSSSSVINLSGSTTSAEAKIREALNKYYAKLEPIKEQSYILGYNYTPKTLNDLLGDSNITTSGYFSETVKLTAGMSKTKEGIVGNTYPCASIDFSAIDSATKLMSLVDRGFDSTCKTCDNHYSVVFTNGLSGSKKTSAGGFDYSIIQKGSNYSMEIDVNSLKNKGVDTGRELASALVDIMSNSYDFHYTQYAADGSKLYIFDDREQSTEAPSAKFYTKPFDNDNMAYFSLKLSDDSGDGGYINLNYEYDLSQVANDSLVAMKDENNDGKYVMNDEGDTSKGFSLYDSSDASMAGKKRYNIVLNYKNSSGAVVSNRNQALDSNVEKIMKEILGKTKVTLQPTDYTKASLKANANANVCMVPDFETTVRKVGDENGLYIVHSSSANDKTWIPRFSMNTVAMGLSAASTKTVKQANDTIAMTSRAKEYVSRKRSTYGALQNRMEHTINNNQNKEENMTAAESRIRDTDMAKEMMTLSNANIIAQAGEIMLSQANQSKQGVLGLLQ